jgi:hypothetical protein
MSKPRTQSEQYFLDRFGAASLGTAAEMAAREFDPDRRPPVNVADIVAKKGIRVRIDSKSPPSVEARLVPLRHSIAIDVKQGVTASRRRFSLAHELGHTIFYRRTANGFSHRIGIASDDERQAEEKICNLFAETLLIPRGLIDEVFVRSATAHPNAIINAIEKTAQACDVSPLVVLCRLNTLGLEGLPFIAICSQYRLRKSNGANGRLRVEYWFPFAWPRRLYIARGRSMDGLALRSPISLFESWRVLPRTTSGRFALKLDSELTTGTEACAHEFPEAFRVSAVVDGKWHETVFPVRVANYLYARRDSTDEDAYVISILTPEGSALNGASEGVADGELSTCS